MYRVDTTWDGITWVSSAAGDLALAGPVYLTQPGAAPLTHRCLLLAQEIPYLEQGRAPKDVLDASAAAIDKGTLGVTKVWSRAAVATSNVCELAYGNGWQIPTVTQLRYVMSADDIEFQSFAFDIKRRLVKFSHKLRPGQSSIDEDAAESAVFCVKPSHSSPEQPPGEKETRACAERLAKTEFGRAYAVKPAMLSLIVEEQHYCDTGSTGLNTLRDTVDAYVTNLQSEFSSTKARSLQDNLEKLYSRLLDYRALKRFSPTGGAVEAEAKKLAVTLKNLENALRHYERQLAMLSSVAQNAADCASARRTTASSMTDPLQDAHRKAVEAALATIHAEPPQSVSLWESTDESRRNCRCSADDPRCALLVLLEPEGCHSHPEETTPQSNSGADIVPPAIRGTSPASPRKKAAVAPAHASPKAPPVNTHCAPGDLVCTMRRAAHGQ